MKNENEQANKQKEFMDKLNKMFYEDDKVNEYLDMKTIKGVVIPTDEQARKKKDEFMDKLNKMFYEETEKEDGIKIKYLVTFYMEEERINSNRKEQLYDDLKKWFNLNDDYELLVSFAPNIHTNKKTITYYNWLGRKRTITTIEEFKQPFLKIERLSDGKIWYC